MSINDLQVSLDGRERMWTIFPGGDNEFELQVLIKWITSIHNTLSKVSPSSDPNSLGPVRYRLHNLNILWRHDAINDATNSIFWLSFLKISAPEMAIPSTVKPQSFRFLESPKNGNNAWAYRIRYSKKSCGNPYLGNTSGLTYKSNFKFKFNSSFF